MKYRLITYEYADGSTSPAITIGNPYNDQIVIEKENPEKFADLNKRRLSNLKRAQKEDLMRSLGLTKVRGTVSGKVYWE